MDLYQLLRQYIPMTREERQQEHRSKRRSIRNGILTQLRGITMEESPVKKPKEDAPKKQDRAALLAIWRKQKMEKKKEEKRKKPIFKVQHVSSEIGVDEFALKFRMAKSPHRNALSKNYALQSANKSNAVPKKLFNESKIKTVSNKKANVVPNKKDRTEKTVAEKRNQITRQLAFDGATDEQSTTAEAAKESPQGQNRYNLRSRSTFTFQMNKNVNNSHKPNKDNKTNLNEPIQLVSDQNPVLKLTKKLSKKLVISDAKIDKKGKSPAKNVSSLSKKISKQLRIEDTEICELDSKDIIENEDSNKVLTRTPKSLSVNNTKANKEHLETNNNFNENGKSSSNFNVPSKSTKATLKQSSINETIVSKVSTNDTKTQEKTPDSKETGFVYVSPFVTLTRGKGSGRKEMQARLERRTLVFSQRCLGDSDSINEQIGVSALVVQQTGASYFRNLLDNKISYLESKRDSWDQYKQNENPCEEALEMIDVAIGQTNLLITKKFEQFRSLICLCETGEGEKPVNCDDLQGFWDMMHLQVDNLESRFANLERLRDSNWTEVQPEVKKRPVKRQPPRKAKTVTASSNLRDVIKAARKKCQQSESQDAAVATPASSSSPALLMMKVSRSAKSLGTSPANTPAKNMALKTPQSILKNSALKPQTPRSILKNSAIKRTSNVKCVLFEKIENENGIEDFARARFSEAPKPWDTSNLIDFDSPKAAVRRSRRISTLIGKENA